MRGMCYFLFFCREYFVFCGGFVRRFGRSFEYWVMKVVGGR